MTAPTGEAPGPTRDLPPLYSTKGKIVIVALLAVAATALGLAVASTQTGEPDSVTQTVSVPLDPDGFGVQPAPGSNVLRQSEIGIDLRPGWEATLIVDGVSVPDEQQRIVGPENQVFFAPGEGQIIERLASGERCVTAIYWESRLGRGVDDGQHTWCFTVA